MVSMSQVWDETLAFAKSESALLVPLAAATLLVAATVIALAAPGMRVGAGGLTSLIVSAAALWSIFGQLAISLLVLRPGFSVGEAMTLAGRRMPRMVLVILLFAVVLTLLFMPFAYALASSGFDPNVPESIERVPAWATFYFFMLLVVGTWLYARLSTLIALIADTGAGVFDSIRRAFAMTRGLAPKLVGLLLLYLAVSLLIGVIAQIVFGSVFTLLGRLMGSEFTGAVLSALSTSAVSTAFTALATVFAALLYRRLSNGI